MKVQHNKTTSIYQNSDPHLIMIWKKDIETLITPSAEDNKILVNFIYFCLNF